MWNKLRRNRVICLSFIVFFTHITVGCGPIADEPPVPGTTATITGTVSGTVVAVFDENGDEVARQTATGNPKTFSLTVPVGGNYRIYLLENEGTVNERIFSLFQSTVNVFAISSAVVVDLGFVDTSTGVAVPTNSPLSVSGVNSGGEDTAVPSSLSGSVFTSSDLAGTWDFHMLTSGDAPQFTGWGFGRVTIDSAGTATTTSMTRSNGDTSLPPASSMTISLSSVVSMISKDFHGTMNSKKDMIVGVMTDGEGGYNLIVYSKQNTTIFSASDLVGTWDFHMLTSGDSPQFAGWGFGRVSINAGGTATAASMTKSNGDTTLPPASSMTISLSGVVSIISKDFHGTMNSQKDMIVGVMTDGGGGYNLIIYSKQGATTFTLSDLAGTWNYKGVISGDAPAQTPGWYRGTFHVDSSGTVSASKITDSLSNSDFTPSPGTINISSSGIITFTDLNYSGVMNGDKNMIIAVATMAPGHVDDVSGFNIQILLR